MNNQGLHNDRTFLRRRNSLPPAEIESAIFHGVVSERPFTDYDGLVCKECFSTKSNCRSSTECECGKRINSALKWCPNCSLRFNRCCCCGRIIVTTEDVEKYKVQQAYKKGYSKGYSDGHSEGYAKCRDDSINAGFILTISVLFILSRVG